MNRFLVAHLLTGRATGGRGVEFIGDEHKTRRKRLRDHRFPVWPFAFSHLVRAALRAISLRCSGVSLAARALPPLLAPSLDSATA